MFLSVLRVYVVDPICQSPTPSWGSPDPILICDELGDDFTLNAVLQLKWSSGEDGVLASERVQFKPNENQPPVPFSIEIPANVLSTKPHSYSSLYLHFSTSYQNGTNFGLEQSEYLTLIEREHIVIQSDKAKYKPGNLVQFRVLMMDVNLKPVQARALRYHFCIIIID